MGFPKMKAIWMDVDLPGTIYMELDNHFVILPEQ